MDNKTEKENLRELSRQIGRSCVCFNLRRSARLLSQVYDQALKPTGLKVTQFSLLVALAGQEGVTMGKLARPLGMDRTTLSRNARPLEKKGLLEISPGDDRREQVLRLTEKGDALLQEAVPLWEGVQQKLTDTMGQNRLEELLLNLRELARQPKRQHN